MCQLPQARWRSDQGTQFGKGIDELFASLRLKAKQ